MSKGLIIFLVACAVAVGVVIYTFKGEGIKFGDDPVVETVEFSVIRYEGKIVSSRLIVDGTGKLKAKHFLSEDKLGVAYYRNAATVKQIQSCTVSRYILDKDGFTQEVIRKEVQLE